MTAPVLLSAVLLSVLLISIGLFLFIMNKPNNGELRAYGQYLSRQCVTCHQLSGAATGIPAIVGWKEHNFTKAMKKYKRKERKNEIMQTIASSLTEKDIKALAVYFGSLKSDEAK